MVGLTLGPDRDAATVARRCLEAGLVINVPGDHMLRFLPALVIERDEVNEALDILRDALR